MTIRFQSPILQSAEIQPIALEWAGLNNRIIKEKLKNQKFGPEEGTFTSKNLNAIFAVAIKLGDALQRHQSGSDTLNRRISWIGLQLKEPLEEATENDPSLLRKALLNSILSIKLSLDHSCDEAIQIGAPYHFIKDLSNFYDEVIGKLEEAGIPKEEFIEASPFKFLRNVDFSVNKNINFDAQKIPNSPFKQHALSENPQEKKLELSLRHPISEIFGSCLIDQSEEISKLILELSSTITFSENKIKISFIQSSDLEKFQTLFRSEDPNVRKLAFTVCLLNFFIKNINQNIEHSIVSFLRINTQLCPKTIVDARGQALWRMEDKDKPFPSFLLREDKPLSSIFLTNNIMALQATEQSVIPPYTFCQDVKNKIPSNWQDESIISYKTSLDVCDLLTKLFHTNTLKGTNKYLINPTLMHKNMELIEGFYDARGEKKTYPQRLKDSRAETIEDFILLLRMSDFSELSKPTDPPATVQKSVSSKKTSKTKAKQKKKEARHLDEPPAAKISTPEGDQSPQIQMRDISEIWQKTTEITANIKLAPRVEAWFISTEAGLMSRPRSESALFSDQEIILTHKLPAEIMHLCFHEDYSRKKILESRPDDTFRVCLIKINGKMHMVEVLMDQNDRIYHFFARPMKNLSDYFTFQDIASEFPSLDHTQENATQATSNSAVLKDNNNIEIFFDNNTYEVLYLSENT